MFRTGNRNLRKWIMVTKRYFVLGTFFLLFIPIFVTAGELYVPSRDYPTIQSAINDAVSGDVVIVAPGTYTGSGNVDLDLNGEAITVKSEINPDNPNPGIIAATIIDCGGDRYQPHRAFRFHSGEGSDSKVLGFTITNGYAQGPAGAPGVAGYIGDDYGLFVPIPTVDDPNAAAPIALNGDPATGDGYGGAILCDGASPTIQYCVIKNSTVTGAQGGDGAPGLSGQWEHYTLADFNSVSGPGYHQLLEDAEMEEDTDGQWGGTGGDGSGIGYGGAIACRSGSNPIISDCTITNNSAHGGCGGYGGPGGYASEFPDYGDGLEGPGGDAGWSIGDGMGGGIYAEGGSVPVITNCTFTNNFATTGIRGTGGPKGQGNEADPPALPTGLDGNVLADGHIAGGAAYYAHSSDADITDCTFTKNKAYSAYVTYSSFQGEDIMQYYPGGALYSKNSNEITLNNCKFTDNAGGAVYCESGCVLDFDGCSFMENSKIANGGALYVDTGCTVNLDSCVFSGNSAYDDGGALKCESNNATLTSCSFSDNKADSDNNGYGYGGAIDLYTSGTTLTMNFDKCSFTENQSIYGGGFSSENFTATFTDCYFVNNTAKAGGGLDLLNGNISITGGVIKGNNATEGDGGGLNCSYTITDIKDCTISDNYANGVYPFGGNGGAINFHGGASNQELFNCLFTGNLAAVDGGAIFCHSAEPDIGNCTFHNNIAGGYGGAIFSDWNSNPSITDSIFCNHPIHAIHEEDFGGDATVTYGLFYGNAGGDYYDSGTGLIYSGDTGSQSIHNIPGGSDNLYASPHFVSGPLGDFYLEQSSSPAVDNGSALATSLLLDTYTTDKNNTPDSGQVDIGYHYLDSTTITKYQLETSVVNGHGSILPASGKHYPGAEVTLTAEPDSGWVVKTWSGTDNDYSTAKTNSVFMNSDRTVTVEFKQPRTLIVAVGGGQGYYSTIQDAVSDAEAGDTVVVYPGTYYGGYFGVILYVDKSITIMSQHPDEPACVAATIIDGYRFSQFNEGWDNIGVTFGPHTNADTIFNGFTIQNCGGHWGDGEDGDRDAGHPNGYDGGCGYGAAIRVQPGGGPVVKNCVITNNLVLSGNGGAGVGATETHNAGRGGWGGWARGGAVYCYPQSNPQFINCRITNNSATGGTGGNGGDGSPPGGYGNYGGNWSMRGSPEYPVQDYDPYSLTITYVTDGHLWERWQWDYALTFSIYGLGGDGIHYLGDYRWYSGYGGGVYCDIGSNVSFTNCTISGNLTQGGISGQGGVYYGGGPTEPLIPYQIPSFGGGVYCAAEATVTFGECVITNNTSSELDPENSLLDPYLGHGGGVCAEDTAMVTFDKCTFSGNQASVGGGLNFADANLEISDSSFINNSAFHGGGLFGEHGPATIIGCDFNYNQAVSNYDPNYDPNLYQQVLCGGGGLHLWGTEAEIIDCDISANEAGASGGGTYFGGEGAPSLTNCLLTNNTSGRDGGGVSANIFNQLTISNCTIADNTVTGFGFGGNYGGGLYCSYESNTDVNNSIIWDNESSNGNQIAIGTGFEFDQAPSTVSVSYSDIQDGEAEVFVEPGCTLNWGSGNIDADPSFVNGYYLSSSSPCIDSGSDTAHSLDMYKHTTTIDRTIDDGIVDMGYHHILSSSLESDFNYDGFVDCNPAGPDYSRFQLHWLDMSCGFPYWCHEKDLNRDGIVNFIDYGIFTSNCGENVQIPLSPTGLTYSAAYSDRIDLYWTDNSDNELGFSIERSTGGGDFSEIDTVDEDVTGYNNMGLQSQTTYTYRVCAYNAAGSSTYSNEISVTTTGVGEEPSPGPGPIPGGDTEPPDGSSTMAGYQTNAQWAVEPSETVMDVDGDGDQELAHTMTAQTADDTGYGGNNPCEYYFEYVSGQTNSSDSGWQSSPTFSYPVGATGLEAAWRVKARDAVGNETGWSSVAYVFGPPL